jgi:hypothetical protein
MTIPSQCFTTALNIKSSKRLSILTLEQKRVLKKLANINGKVSMKSFLAKFDLELLSQLSNLPSRIL